MPDILEHLIFVKDKNFLFYLRHLRPFRHLRLSKMRYTGWVSCLYPTYELPFERYTGWVSCLYPTYELPFERYTVGFRASTQPTNCHLRDTLVGFRASTQPTNYELPFGRYTGWVSCLNSTLAPIVFDSKQEVIVE